MSVSEDEFKRCMGAWPSGVTIVTTRSGERIHGMTVSDFSGASLSPALVAVCCNRESTTTRLIEEGKCFAVNILAADQQDLSNRFASRNYESSRFEGIDFEQAVTGAPLLPGAVANIDCRLAFTHDAGDHVIFLGEVLSIRLVEKEPLVFCRGSYRQLGQTL